MKRLEAARDRIALQVAERDAEFSQNAPSKQWVKGTRALSYVFSLPEEHLASIRLHCDLFLGENTSAQILGAPVDYLGYLWLSEGLPVEVWAEETVVGVMGEPIGARLGDRYLTATVTLIQRYLCNLLRLGVADGDHVVEIGAGFGGLMHALLSARNIRVTIIDLPETIIFSAVFLLNLLPDKRVYIYAPGDDPRVIDWTTFDLVFLPDYRADWLRQLPRADFAVNTVSFPEMSAEALDSYVDLLADVLDGPLMSVNYFAKDDVVGVPEKLARRFALAPTPDAYMAALDINETLYRDHNHRPTTLCFPPGYDRSKLDGVILRDIVMHERVLTTFTSTDVTVSRA